MRPNRERYAFSMNQKQSFNSIEALETIRRLSDEELRVRIQHLRSRERRTTAALLAHLAEFDQRRLYRERGCSSLFAYCTEVLQLSEHEAYPRMVAARAVQRFPLLLQRLADGSVHLTAIAALAPVLTPENHV